MDMSLHEARAATLLWILALFALSGCGHDPDAYLPTLTFITLNVEPSTLPADGRSSAVVTATIDPNASRRTIVFATTSGTLVGASDGELKVTANAQGIATGLLKSPENPGEGFVSATVQGAEQEVGTIQHAVTFSAADPDDTLRLSSPEATALADGLSVIELHAVVGEGITSVQLWTTIGEFNNGEDEITVSVVTSTRRAVTQLTSTRAGRGQVTASAGTVSAVIDVEFFVPGEDYVVIGVSRSSAPADGATMTEVFADVAHPGQEVVFTATHGTFTNGQVLANSQRRATTLLRSHTSVATARLTARSGLVEDSTTLEFERALPDGIVMQLDRLQLQASTTDEAVATVHLSRQVGAVTEGTELAFSAWSDRDEDRGDELEFVFRNQTLSDAEEQVSAGIVAGETGFRGRARIEACVAGSSICGDAMIEIVDPQAPRAASIPAVGRGTAGIAGG